MSDLVVDFNLRHTFLRNSHVCCEYFCSILSEFTDIEALNVSIDTVIYSVFCVYVSII